MIAAAAGSLTFTVRKITLAGQFIPDSGKAGVGSDGSVFRTMVPVASPIGPPVTPAKQTHVFWLVALVLILAWQLWLGAFGCATLLALAAAAWGVSLLRSFRADRMSERIARGCCPECGYDLRGSPHLCPECGHVPPHGVGLEFKDWLAAEFGAMDRGAPGRSRTGVAAKDAAPESKGGVQASGEPLDNASAAGNNPPR